MSLFRRKPLHEQLAEEGGLVEPTAAPLFTGVIPETGIHGIPRERQYDAVVTVEAPDVEGASALFVALEDGSLLVEEGEGDLTALADAIEQEMARPYRATGIHRGGARWAVAAHGLRVLELPEPGRRGFRARLYSQRAGDAAHRFGRRGGVVRHGMRQHD